MSETSTDGPNDKETLQLAENYDNWEQLINSWGRLVLSLWFTQVRERPAYKPANGPVFYWKSNFSYYSSYFLKKYNSLMLKKVLV